MEDLTEKITSILSDPEMMNTIKGISGLLDSSGEKTSQHVECETNKENTGSENSLSVPSFSPDIMQIMLKLMPALSSLKKDDKYTNFLKALRPLLPEQQRKMIDMSTQLLQIVRILPFLKESGMF